VTPPASKLRVVVTCTRRKRRPVPALLHLGNVPGARISTRFHRWTELLASPVVPTVPAIDLYAGEHWTAARDLREVVPPGHTFELWVCSAGYGLISSETELLPYSATFAARDPDVVPGPAQEWWEALCGWVGPALGPRSLGELAASDPTARILLVLSADYLRACHDDVFRAAQKLADSGQLSIISTGTGHSRDLNENLLPGDARLQASFGGTLKSLNVRTARYLLAEGLIGHAEMAERLEMLLSRAAPQQRPERRRATDREIRAFIRRQVATDPKAAHTRLLRQLRDENYACEQGRFAALFEEEKQQSL
jgi:hypothetical protein